MRCTTERTTRATRSASPVTDVVRKILTVAVASGLLVGLIMALVLQFTTTPLILKAEVYERAAQTQEGKSVLLALPRPGVTVLRVHDHRPAGDKGSEPSVAAPKHESAGWEPAEGFQRTAATSVATVAVATGYALVLLGCMLFARDRITPSCALLWALAGFSATGLAPALGLAPELPGSAAGDLMLRQFWWAATVVGTAIGLYLLVRQPQPSAKAAGLALLVAPHLIGAPRPAAFESTAPAELAASFAATSLVVHALLWCLVGLSVGWFWTRIAADVPRVVEARA